jgi:hypothetical protein
MRLAYLYVWILLCEELTYIQSRIHVPNMWWKHTHGLVQFKICNNNNYNNSTLLINTPFLFENKSRIYQANSKKDFYTNKFLHMLCFQAHKYIFIHVHKCTYTHVCKNTRTYKYIFIHVHKCTYTHVCKNTRTYLRKYLHNSYYHLNSILDEYTWTTCACWIDNEKLMSAISNKECQRYCRSRSRSRSPVAVAVAVAVAGHQAAKECTKQS